MRSEGLAQPTCAVDNVGTVNGLLITFGPLLLLAVTALVATPILRPVGPDLSGSAVPLGLLIGQIAMAPLAWALIWAAPNERSIDGASACPAIGSGSAIEITLYGLFFGSCVVGGFALAATYAADRPELRRTTLFALIVLLAPFGIAAGLAYDIVCAAT
jgi:hypothetical protein